MRVAPIAAGVLACAATAMAVVAFTTGGGKPRPVPAAAPAPVAAHDGKSVWVALGCGSCHTFAPASATGQFGPDLTQSLKGVPESYIRESIVEPSKVTAPGFDGGMMPEDFSDRMSPVELRRLVEFIRSGVRN